MSVKRKVTVPVGRSGIAERLRDRLVERQPLAAPGACERKD
jgi:hypothetical protein